MFFFENYEDAIILKLISEWTEQSKISLGRTVIQKLCYFAETFDIPLRYRFSVYQYGPYSQELYTHIDDLVVSGLVNDRNMPSQGKKADTSVYSVSEPAKHLLSSHDGQFAKIEDRIRTMVDFFKKKTPRELELLSTTHYYYTANKNFYGRLSEEDLKARTIQRVMAAKKEKFSQDEIGEAYSLLKDLPQFS